MNCDSFNRKRNAGAELVVELNSLEQCSFADGRQLLELDVILEIQTWISERGMIWRKAEQCSVNICFEVFWILSSQH